MRPTLRTVLVALVLAACSATSADPAPAGLTVAPEGPRDGYDRSLFGDHDRDALLAVPQPCAGWYSAADDTCHRDAGGVEVDHIVALAEAWDSGARGWDDGRLEAFGSASENQWLMTAGLNRSKSDDDPTGWLPPHEPAVCDYVAAYVGVKVEWGLTVDAAERAALAGTGCEVGL